MTPHSMVMKRKSLHNIEHYLINVLDRILTAVDWNGQKEAFAVIVTMVDWSQAFDRQSYKLGIQSFLEIVFSLV